MRALPRDPDAARRRFAVCAMKRALRTVQGDATGALAPVGLRVPTALLRRTGTVPAEAAR